MTKIIYFEYCALIIEIIILVSIYQRNMIRGRLNRWYIMIVLATTMATISDIIGMLLEASGPGNIFAKYVANAVCLCTTALGTFFLCEYLFAQTGVWYLIRKEKIMNWIFCTPMLINTFILFFVNPFTHQIFYIDADGVYARGDNVLILYVIALTYVYIGGCVAIRYRKTYTTRKLISIFALLGSSIFATLIQFVFPDVVIQMFFTACATLIILIEVHAPEERISAGTGLLSLNAYVSDMKNLFEVGARFDVTLIVITNYSALIDMLGYFNSIKMLQIVSKRLIGLTTGIWKNADIYYLDSGRFALVTDRFSGFDGKKIANDVNKELLKEVEIADSKVMLMVNVCSIACPEEIDEADYLISRDEMLSLEAYTGEVSVASKLFNKVDFEFRRDFVKIIDRALNSGYLSIEYQPILNVIDNRYTSVEAFIRFNDPDFGYIDPRKLISEAERGHTIHAITAFVVEEVCKFLSDPEFLLLGFDYVEINLSPVQCMWGDLITVLLSTVRAYNVDPRRICFNITDVDSYALYMRMKDNLLALTQVGFSLVMDDFGAGIFEIERIAELPLVGIKLERQFVKNGFYEENLSVLKGTVRMINDMGISCGAVGVEDEKMVSKLIDLGCVQVQGYHYCKPMNRKDLVRFILLN